ncbi:MAG: hypothetical protein LBV80_10885 [Deltaproteobacteria bacterium]|jgi:hypothetical protein|nr:hypothetical protein [Deltaproteobacteria bacterium]
MDKHTFYVSALYGNLYSGDMQPGDRPATQSEVAAWFNPPKSLPEQINMVMSAVQARLDNFAATRGYDGILSAASYAFSSNPAYAAEGQYCVEVRDATWEFVNAYLNAVLSGEKAIPVWEELAAQLDAAAPLVWPAAAAG